MFVVAVVVRMLTVHHLLSKFIMKIAPTNKLLEGQVPNHTLYLGTYTNSASVTNICVNYMLAQIIWSTRRLVKVLPGIQWKFY